MEGDNSAQLSEQLKCSCHQRLGRPRHRCRGDRVQRCRGGGCGRRSSRLIPERMARRTSSSHHASGRVRPHLRRPRPQNCHVWGRGRLQIRARGRRHSPAVPARQQSAVRCPNAVGQRDSGLAAASRPARIPRPGHARLPGRGGLPGRSLSSGTRPLVRRKMSGERRAWP